MLEVSHPSVVVSALKPGRDGSLVLRLYEATGAAANGARVKVSAGLTSVSEVNLMEDDLKSVPVQGTVSSLTPVDMRSRRSS